MSDDVDDFLAHYGVKGMRWGKRNASTIAEAAGLSSGKAPLNKQGQLKRPDYVRSVMLGSWSNSKKRYTDPQALKTRTAAGKLFAAALIGSVGASALAGAASMSKSASTSAGLAIASQMLSKGAGAVGTAGLITGVIGVRQERVARATAATP